MPFFLFLHLSLCFLWLSFSLSQSILFHMTSSSLQPAPSWLFCRLGKFKPVLPSHFLAKKYVFHTILEVIKWKYQHSFEVACAAHDWPTQKVLSASEANFMYIWGGKFRPECLAFNDRSLLQISPEIISQWLSITTDRTNFSRVRPEKTLNIAQSTYPHFNSK